MAKVKVILVVDKPEVATDIKHIVESFNYEVPYTASTGKEALHKAEKTKPYLILINTSLKGDMDGIEVASQVKKLGIPVIFLTSHTADEIVHQAMATKPYGYLVKPFQEVELKFAIEMALYKKKVENELRWSDNRLKIGMDIGKMVYWEYDTEKDLFTFDEQFYSLYGTSGDEEGGNQMSSAEYANRFVPVEEQALVGVEVDKALETDDPNFSSTVGHWMVRGDGERRYILVRIRVRMDENGKKLGTRGVNQDITEQKMAEDALKEADQRISDIINFFPDASFTIDADGRVISWNRAINQMTKVNPEEILGKGNYEYSIHFYGQRRPMLIDMINASDDEIKKQYPNYERQGKVLTAETDVIIRGEVRTAWIKVVPLEDSEGNYIGAIEALRDVTSLRNAENKLKKSLYEKEMLLKEIHHRVKNNLMIISSLLNLQANYLKDQESIDIFKESQNRAQSMALIHQRLYQSDDLKSIGFKEYISTLARDLYQSYVNDPGRISLQLNIEDVDIDIDHAIPLGLILNEIITNSMKYGFPGDLAGKIFVDLRKNDDEYILIVGDDGVGIPSDIDLEKSSTLGMQLINGLTGQIGGEIELNRDNGTEFKITFKERY